MVFIQRAIRKTYKIPVGMQKNNLRILITN
jgi:hypothetical protein